MMSANGDASVHDVEAAGHVQRTVMFDDRKNTCTPPDNSDDVEYERRRLRFRTIATVCDEHINSQGQRGERKKTIFETWYPDASIFKWRFTTAYWSAVTCIVGAILFTYAAIVQCFHGRSWTSVGLSTMTSWPNFIGGCIFGLSTYFQYMQLINIHIDEKQPWVLLIPDWNAIRGRVGMESVMATLAYVVGAVIFQIPLTVAVLPPLSSPTAIFVLSTLPNFVGAGLFVVGTVCEIIHYHKGEEAVSLLAPDFWAVALNAIGSFTFFLCSVPDVLLRRWTGEGKDAFVDLNGLIGCVCFILAGCVYLVMWRGQDYGLTKLRQLNRMREKEAGAGRHSTKNVSLEEDNQHTFSLAGLAFILVASWFVCTSFIHGLAQYLQYIHSMHENRSELLLQILEQVFVLLTIALVLLVHSAVVRVPDVQPYRASMFLARMLLIFGTVVKTVIVLRFLLFDSDYQVSLPGEIALPGELRTRGN